MKNTSAKLLLFLLASFLVIPRFLRADDDIVTINHTLLTHANNYKTAATADKPSHLKMLRETVLNRKRILLSILEKDPGLFLQNSLSSEERDQLSLPLDLDGDVEKHGVVTGTLEVRVEDTIKLHSSRRLYRLQKSDDKKFLHLNLAQGQPSMKTGTVLTVSGVTLDDHLVTESLGPPQDPNPPGGGDDFPPVVTPGNVKVLVFLANFQDSINSCSVPNVQTSLFTGTGSVNNYYQDTSFGATGLDGRVVPMTIEATSTDPCNYLGWMAEADRAATAAGVDTNGYDRKLYLLPSNNACATSISGIAALGGTWATVFNCNIPAIIAHEEGHNYGMEHAATPTDEYGDISDVMGQPWLIDWDTSGRIAHTNAPHKIQMGWIPPSRVQTISSQGSYVVTLHMTETADSIYPLAVKIPIPGSSNAYYLSYREPVRFDRAGLLNPSPWTMSFLPDYRYRTSVHTYSGYRETYYSTGLYDNQSMSDNTLALTVRQISHDPVAHTATISIGLGESLYAQSFSSATQENTPLNVYLNVTGQGNHQLAYNYSSPVHGTLSGSAPNLVYTPTQNFVGADSFNFSAHDGSIASNLATALITVQPTDVAPVAFDQVVHATACLKTTITLMAADPDSNSVECTIVTSPSHGVLSSNNAQPPDDPQNEAIQKRGVIHSNVVINSNVYFYTSDANYVGSDSFTFKAFDSILYSPIATVSIVVKRPNSPPVAGSQTITTAQGAGISVTLTANDPDNDCLTYSAVTNPTHGALFGNPPNLFYTPEASYTGPDLFTFKACDGISDSNVASISITVNPNVNILSQAATPEINYFNPIHGEQAIVNTNLVEPKHVKVTIHNPRLRAEELETIFDGDRPPGPYSYSWNGRIHGEIAPAGYYLMLISENGGKPSKHKLILVK